MEIWLGVRSVRWKGLDYVLDKIVALLEFD